MAHYIMLTQANCKYCTAALGLLKSHGHEVDVYDVQDPETRLTVAMLKQTNTVPQIFAPDGTYIGGYTELKDYIVPSAKEY